MIFNCPGPMTAEPQGGAVVLSDDLKNPAMEKLDLVRKWSISTYKVILSVLDLFLCPPCTQPHSLSSLLIRMLAEKWTRVVTCNFFCITLCNFASLCHFVFFFLLAYIQTLYSVLNAVNLLLMCVINKLPVLHSVLGKSCQRSWVVVRGLWTWS